MDRNELNVALAGILTTLHELKTDVAESIVYMALDMDWNRYQVVRSMLEKAGLITVSMNRISLTPKGTELAIKCEEAMAKK